MFDLFYEGRQKSQVQTDTKTGKGLDSFVASQNFKTLVVAPVETMHNVSEKTNRK